MSRPSEGKIAMNKGKIIAVDKLIVPPLEDELYAFTDVYLTSPNEKEEQKVLPCYFSCRQQENIMEDPVLIESFLNHPPLRAMENPITLQNVQRHQFMDLELNEIRRARPDMYPVKNIEGRPLICVKDRANDPQGLDRFRVPGLRHACENYKCASCQMNRQPGPGYGMLPPRLAPLMPWSDIAVDLIGPWKINIQGVEVEFNALTSIDLVSNLAEIVRIDNKTAEHIAQKFENSWLARYPRPINSFTTMEESLLVAHFSKCCSAMEFGILQ
eukprot:816324-Ditylum_brightwellii.AAC.2